MRTIARATRQDTASETLIRQVRNIAQPLNEQALDNLVERLGHCRLVLLGEASHGTAEYYTWRARISRRLIQEKGFSFIGVEGDWPDCYRLNRWIKGRPEAGSSAREVLHAFERWPTWMWANEEIVELATWLRQHNDPQPEEHKVGFYGLDVYSLWDSLYQVMSYLQKVAPEGLAAARRAYQCFEPYGEDVQEYARATAWVPTSCEEEVVALLEEVRHQRGAGGFGDAEDAWVAEQNAMVVKNAEAYYRAMIHGGPESWNLRDWHMIQTLGRLLERHGPQARAIIWEHNTHIGDARFTDMAEDGMVNVGQLARQRWGESEAFLVGFACHRGRVIAGRAWDSPMERMRVPPARPGSWEDVLHTAGAGGDRLLLFDEENTTEEMREVRGQRAIGVVYRPEYEHWANYVPTVLPRRYDALLYLDRTEALHPLQLPVRVGKEVPETYPSGL
jgi:erythromycin esterase-like protein